jgi:hypothetical protein
VFDLKWCKFENARQGGGTYNGHNERNRFQADWIEPGSELDPKVMAVTEESEVDSVLYERVFVP